MSKSIPILIASIASLSAIKKGSKSLIQYNGLNPDQIEELVNHFRALTNGYDSGVESLEEVVRKIDANPYINKFNHPNYGEMDIPIYLIEDPVIRLHRDLFHTNKEVPIFGMHAEIQENGMYKIEPSIEIKDFLQQRQAEHPIVFYRTNNNNEESYNSYLSIVSGLLSRSILQGKTVNGIAFDKSGLIKGAKHKSEIPQCIEKNSKDIINRISIPKWVPALFDPFDFYLMFTSKGSIIGAEKHETRHFIENKLRSRSPKHDPSKEFLMPRKYKLKKEGHNRRPPVESAFKPEFSTIIGDTYDRMMYPCFKDEYSQWKPTPDLEGKNISLIKFIMKNLYNGRNNSGIPSDKLVEELGEIFNASGIIRLKRDKKMHTNMDYFHTLERECLKTVYRAGQEIYNQYRSFFNPNQPFLKT